MLDVTEVLERRLLAALESATAAGPPDAWARLEAPRGGERQAAAVLVRLAERPSREEMIEEARKIAAAVAKRREKREPQPLWEEVAELLEALGEGPDGAAAAGVFGLALWRRVKGFPLEPIHQTFRGVAPDAPARPELLAGAARVLLRARARRWVEDDLATTRSAGKRPAAAAEGGP